MMLSSPQRCPTSRRRSPTASKTGRRWSVDLQLGGAGNLCGLPSITVPNGFGERGLPTGLEMMARAYNDGRVLAAAMRFQELTGWHTRQPELSVAR